MKTASHALHLADQTVDLVVCDALSAETSLLFGPVLDASSTTTTHAKRVLVDPDPKIPGNFIVTTADGTRTQSLERQRVFGFTLEAVADALVTDLKSAVALHAAAVQMGGETVLISGPKGTGKSTLAALLVENGFDYLTDSIVAFDTKTAAPVDTFSGAITLGEDGLAALPDDGILKNQPAVLGPRSTMIPVTAPTEAAFAKPSLVIFPKFVAGSQAHLVPLTAAVATFRLLESNLNARNIAAGGLPAISRLSLGCMAVEFTYGHASQIKSALLPFIHQVQTSTLSLREQRDYMLSFVSQDEPAQTVTQEVIKEVAPTPTVYPIPAATPPRGKRKLTIGMSTYDDYDGVYFTIQSLRLHHAEALGDTEFIIIDNNPTGPCAQPLKDMEKFDPHIRYVPFNARASTAVRDQIFIEATGDIVLVMDCHVILPPGVLAKLIAYFDANPDTVDLLQGPMFNDTFDTISTHFAPGWSGGMYGTWATDERGKDPDGDPFDIISQGMGLYACRREAWPYFNIAFKGFGGEEGYIHEKVRRLGGRTLCLPFLRWVHRFQRPMGVPYAPTWEDRIRNYIIGFRENEADDDGLRDHFIDKIGVENMDRTLAAIDRELSSPFCFFDSIHAIQSPETTVPSGVMVGRFEALHIDKRVSYHTLSIPGTTTETDSDVCHTARLRTLREIITQAKKRKQSNLLVCLDTIEFQTDAPERLETLLAALETKAWGIALLDGASEQTSGKEPLKLLGKQSPGAVWAIHETAFDPILVLLPRLEDDGTPPKSAPSLKAILSKLELPVLAATKAITANNIG